MAAAARRTAAVLLLAAAALALCAGSVHAKAAVGARGRGGAMGPAPDAAGVLKRVSSRYYGRFSEAAQREADRAASLARAANATASRKNATLAQLEREQGAPNRVAVEVSNTISGLTTVLHKMYASVRANEKAFQAFKGKLLEQVGTCSARAWTALAC